MECKPHEMVPPRSDNPYPCSNEMRMWAIAHRDDEGDALGYVREVKDDRYRA